MSAVSEQVRLLLEGMRGAMDRYRAGGLTLDRLAWELKSRISALNGGSDQAWVEELRSAWNQIEYVNAFWIESGRESLTGDERKSVDEALVELSVMLLEY